MVNNRYVARIKCKQPIPCNPCETSCPFGAIYIGEDITNMPVLDEDKCRGCGICVGACPGIAITMAKVTGEDIDHVAIPYEYFPLPNVGDKVTLVDVNGIELGAGVVEQLRKPDKNDPTTLVFTTVNREITDRAVGIKRIRMVPSIDESITDESIMDDPIICRCEEIRESEIVEAIARGDCTVDAIKRRTRGGMGLCQGKTCNRLISAIIARETGVSVGSQSPSYKRPPVGAISIDELNRDIE